MPAMRETSVQVRNVQKFGGASCDVLMGCSVSTLVEPTAKPIVPVRGTPWNEWWPKPSGAWKKQGVAIPLAPSTEDAKKLATSKPSLGVVRLDYDYAPTPGDINHPGSFGYNVIYRVVPGLTFEMCEKGTMPDEIKERFVKAIKWLDGKGVVAITGDCSFFMNFQALAREVTSRPVFMSAMCAMPSVMVTYAKHEQIAVITANSKSFEGDLGTLILGQPMLRLMKDECGVDLDERRFVIVGCEKVPGFEAVAKGQRVDVSKVKSHMVKLAKDVLAKQPKDKPIRAFLFESTELPPYSDAVRAATGLPVFDVLTTCNAMLAGMQNNQRFGVDEWRLSWDKKQGSKNFGSKLTPGMRKLLVNEPLDIEPDKKSGGSSNSSMKAEPDTERTKTQQKV